MFELFLALVILYMGFRLDGIQKTLRFIERNQREVKVDVHRSGPQDGRRL
jgi:hypothetical protein